MYVLISVMTLIEAPAGKVLDGDLRRDGGNGDRLAEFIGAGATDAEDLAASGDVQAARCRAGLAVGQRDDVGIIGAGRDEGDGPRLLLSSPEAEAPPAYFFNPRRCACCCARRMRSVTSSLPMLSSRDVAHLSM